MLAFMQKKIVKMVFLKAQKPKLKPTCQSLSCVKLYGLLHVCHVTLGDALATATRRHQTRTETQL